MEIGKSKKYSYKYSKEEGDASTAILPSTSSSVGQNLMDETDMNSEKLFSILGECEDF